MFNKKQAWLEDVLEMRKRENEDGIALNEKESSFLSIEDFEREDYANKRR